MGLLAGKQYPIYLFHWHPLKAQFEWRRDLDIKHSMKDVLAGQYFANFFMKQGQFFVTTPLSLVSLRHSTSDLGFQISFSFLSRVRF